MYLFKLLDFKERLDDGSRGAGIEDEDLRLRSVLSVEPSDRTSVVDDDLAGRMVVQNRLRISADL
jgi:hypothetical protein